MTQHIAPRTRDDPTPPNERAKFYYDALTASASAPDTLLYIDTDPASLLVHKAALLLLRARDQIRADPMSPVGNLIPLLEYATSHTAEMSKHLAFYEANSAQELS